MIFFYNSWPGKGLHCWPFICIFTPITALNVSLGDYLDVPIL